MRLRRIRTGFTATRAVRAARFPAVAGALALAVMTGAAGCATSGPVTSGAAYLPPPRAEMAQPDLSKLPEVSTFTTVPNAVPDPAPGAATNGAVLALKSDVAAYDAPNGNAFARIPAAQLHNPTWLPIIARSGEWVQVLLPSRPNGSTGWVRANDPARTQQAKSPYVVDVDVDARRMVIRQNGRETGSWTVGVGAERSPTPKGRTFIMASIEETVTRFSPIILPMGTHSETFNSYGGGPGTVALHGWPSSSVFGKASSDGCVRVPDDALRQLTTVPLGTVVLLR